LSDKGGDEAAAARLNTPVHWIHGITLGAVRGALGLTGLGAVAATAVHYAAVWGGDVLLYRTLGNRRPIRPGVSGRGSLTDAARRAFLSSPPTASTSRS
jgi:hypothetical protein